ncbi:hypothetical protein OYT95_24380 [Rhodococcus sp. JS3073]|nr:hypothetical protein [Rhodococcus sp. JS3073]WAM12575.1 hypothetical protein OYT95_24380 [Rhodococcus sp. JS3073]
MDRVTRCCASSAAATSSAVNAWVLPQHRPRDRLEQSGIGSAWSAEDRRAGGDRSEGRRLDDVLRVELRAVLGHGVADPFEDRAGGDRRLRYLHVDGTPAPRLGGQGHPQTAGIGMHRVGVKAGRRRGGVLFTDRRGGNGVQQVGRVADRSGEGELVDVPEPGLADQWAAGDSAAARFQADKPAARGRHPERTGAVVAVRQRNRPGGDECSGAAARPAGAAIERPRIACRPVPPRFRREVQPELRRCRLPQGHQSGRPEPRHEFVIHPGDRAADAAATECERHAFRERATVLDEERHPCQWTVGPVIESRVEQRQGQCAEVGIGPRDRRTRNGFDLRCRHLTRPDQLTQTDGVELGVLVQFQRSTPQVATTVPV